MRTDEEILDRIESLKLSDPLGFERSDLLMVLPFSKAKFYLNEEFTNERWVQQARDRDSVLKQMRDYMEFAWDVANRERGVSANRSMSHYSAWTWLIGDDFGNLQKYTDYGKPHLARLCEHYGWDWTQWAGYWRP